MQLQLSLAVCMSGSHWNGTKRGGTSKTWKYFQKSTETFCLSLCGQKCAQRSPWSVTKVGIMEGSSSHVWMCELDRVEGWALKKWCFRTIVLEKTLERPLDSKIKPVNPKGNQPKHSSEGLILNLKRWCFGHQCEESTHWKRPWCWERLKAGGEGDDRGWDGSMASLTQWTRVWANSRR